MTDIFVFGSNREGRHGRGAALYAYTHYGALYGQPSGRQGNSYAIVTKELRRGMPPVSLAEIQRYVEEFLIYASQHPEDTFILTKVGCGLAGFQESQIAPFFKTSPPNVQKPEGW